jgi:hypothetical protein
MPTRGLPDYVTGTIGVTNNSRSVTGSGTGWTTTLNGVTEVTIGAGDFLIVGTGRPIMVESVESATALTLTEVWPNATAAGTAYKIRRYVALPTGTVLQAVQALEAKGADTNPLTSWTLDGGTTRLKLRQAAGGQAALSVGTTGAADGSLLDAILINTSGNVGIGGAPAYRLDVQQSLAGTLAARVYNSSTSTSASSQLRLETGTANVTATINVTNGGGTPYANLSLGTALTAIYLDLGYTIFRNKSGSQNNLTISDSGDPIFYSATNALVQAQASSGYAGFQAAASAGNPSYFFFKTGAAETGRIQVAPGGDIIFANGSGATERARISSTGNFLVACTVSSPVTSRVNGWNIGGNGFSDIRQGGAINLGVSTSSGSHFQFYTDNGSAAVAAGSISSSGSTTTYNTSSDRRLKTDIITLPGALDRVMSLPARAFRWRSEAFGPRVDGFIADEVMKVAPQAVIGAPGAEDDDGKPIYQQIDHSKMVPVLWAAVQELTARVTHMSNRILNIEVAA